LLRGFSPKPALFASSPAPAGASASSIAKEKERHEQGDALERTRSGRDLFSASLAVTANCANFSAGGSEQESVRSASCWKVDHVVSNSVKA